MKKFNLLIGIKSMSFILTVATLNHVAFADGTATGNSTGPIAYNGVMKNIKEPRLKAEVQLNDNQVDINNKIILSHELDNLKYLKISPYDLLVKYSFPNKKEELDELYKKSIKLDGNFSTLMNNSNPFLPYINGNLENLQKMVTDPVNFAFPLERRTFDLMTNGIKMNVNLAVNPKLKECHLCSPQYYKPIPKDGIDLEVVCYVDSVAGEDRLLYRHDIDDEHNIEYATNVFTRISTQQDILKISTPVLTDEATQNIISRFCRNPEMSELKVKISCRLQGKTTKDKNKLSQSFGIDKYRAHKFHLGTHFIDLVSQKKLNNKQAEAFNLNKELEMDQGDYVQSVEISIPNTPIWIPLKDSYYNILSYKFPYESFSREIVYFQSEASLADLVRRSFISSYEALNKKDATP